MNELTMEQTIKLIERGVLEKNSSQLIIKGVSLNDIDEYMIDTPIIMDKTIKFKVVRVRDLTERIIDYKQIYKIGGMPIDKVLSAYSVDENYPEEIDVVTDVVRDVIGQKSATIDGIELQEGMKFIFENDVTPKYKNRILKVKFVDGVINLVANRGRPKKIRE